MSTEVPHNTNSSFTPEDYQPRHEGELPPTPDYAPTVSETRLTVNPDHQQSPEERHLHNRGRKFGAMIAIAVASLGAGFGISKGVEAFGSQKAVEQPAGDSHTSGDILNQNNSEQATGFKDLESGKDVATDRFKYILNGKEMTLADAVKLFELERDEFMTDEQMVAQLAQTIELRVNSGLTKEEYDKYKDYQSLPAGQTDSTRGLRDVYDETYRGAGIKAMGMNDKSYTGVFQFKDTIDHLAYAQQDKYTAAMEKGDTTPPRAKVEIASSKRNTLAEQSFKGTARATDRIYDVTFTVNNGVDPAVFVEKATFQFAQGLNAENKPVWNFYDVRDVQKGATVLTSPASAKPTPSATKK